MTQLTPRRFLFALGLFALASASGACRREHLSSNFGQAYVSWFQAQHVNTKGTVSELTRKNLDGLDAQEAGMVSKNYRRNASGKSADDASGGRLLMIGPSRGGGEAYVPPPSVPAGQ